MSGTLNADNSATLATTAYCAHKGTVGSNATQYGTGLVLASGASTNDNVYIGMVVELVDGPGRGQTRTITAYTGSTLTATVDAVWVAPPTTNSKYVVHPFSGACASPGEFRPENQCVLATATLPNVDDFFNGTLIGIVAGKGAGQVRTVADYDGASGLTTTGSA